MGCNGLTAGPTPAPLLEALRGWTATVLAVCYHTGLGPQLLLHKPGRSSAAVTRARKLLLYLCMEVSDAGELLTLAWLEHATTLTRRRIQEVLRTERPPQGFAAVLATYETLCMSLDHGTLRIAAAAGVLHATAAATGRIWPRDFFQDLGLK
jgi:hypothetical protein